MNKRWLYLLLAVSLGIGAQQPDAQFESSAAIEPAEESAETAADDSAPPGDTKTAEELTAAEFAEEEFPEEIAELEPGEEAAEPTLDDFDPEEEISEDFPVPLPSDI